ncbi:type I toxin-antitoxin system Fst family toxin [Lactococcus lactis]|uniref:Type I toxin-antitoxin system Fst family toxin n=1 Tax=Lactococcus lactis TaxID=1358 RepID=A0A9X4NIG8_9LACT|nr:type I toxin-antitoxin system Fst family toxin [Lactococcus lactis]MDG4984362.1 type I toxin-antitoxin system Fst family toxin [Lactococcus lactis]
MLNFVSSIIGSILSGCIVAIFAYWLNRKGRR